MLVAVRLAHRSLPGLISLEPDERRALDHMGPRSEPFGRGTVSLLARNPQIVPPSLDVAGALADIDAIDKLRPIAEAVAQLNAQLQDTLAALGHDVMDVALDGYAQLMIAGLRTASKTCAARWARVMPAAAATRPRCRPDPAARHPPGGLTGDRHRRPPSGA